MEKRNFGLILLILSLLNAALIITVSIYGLITPAFYSRETFNWQVQSLGQDSIDLFLLVPVLIVSSVFAFKRNRAAVIIWSGTVFYLIYTFAIYTFDVHFNKMFVLYCLVLGLSFYSFAYFVYLQISAADKLSEWFSEKAPIKTTGIYMIAVSLLFYYVWLSDIIPAIMKDSTPKTLVESGLTTNPVQVIDLALILPGLILTGVFLIRRRALAFLFSMVMLVFTIHMNITIGALIVMMKNKGLEAEISLAAIFTVMSLFSLVLLIGFIRSLKSPEIISTKQN